MKVFLSIAFLFVILVHKLSAQTYLQVTADSVRVVNGELIIDNNTSDIKGVLTNTGSGVTRFKKLQLVNIGDSSVAIIGQDTLEWKNAALETVETINDLEQYSGKANVIIVKDTLRGGIFYKSDDDLVADSGVVFNSKDGEYWVRQFNKSDGLNVCWYGANGQDSIDDYPFIKKALLVSWDEGIFVYFPRGIFLTSRTLYIAGKWKGAGINNTTIRAAYNALFDTIETISYNGINDRCKYRPMICTPNAQDDGSIIFDYLKGVELLNMTLDYNNTPMNGRYSPVCVLMGKTDGARLNNLKFINCVNSDINSYPVNYGSCLYFSFSKNADCNAVHLLASGFESLMVRNKCVNIRFHNGTIEAKLPFNRNYSQYHLFQIAVGLEATPEMKLRYPDDYKPYGLYIYDNYITINSYINDIGSCHNANGFFIYNNIFKYKPTLDFISDSLTQLGLKPFAGSNDVLISNNYFDYRQYNRQGIPALISPDWNYGSSSIQNRIYPNTPSGNFHIEENIIDLHFDSTFSPPQYYLNHASVIGSINSPIYFGTISNNIINISNYSNDSLKIMGFKGKGLTISGNKVIFSDPANLIDSAGPVVLYVDSLYNSTIINNIAQGNYGSGLLIDTSFNLMIEGNSFEAEGESYNIDELLGRSFFKNNVGADTSYPYPYTTNRLVGSAVFDGGSSDYTVAYSASFTPSKVIITPTSSDAANALLFVDKSTITSNEFIVKVAGTAAAGTGNITFDYELIK